MLTSYSTILWVPLCYFFLQQTNLILIVNLKISNYVENIIIILISLLITVYFIILCVVCKETNKTSDVLLQDEYATLQLKNLNFI